MTNRTQLDRIILNGLCLKCFYLDYEQMDNSFICAKYKTRLDGKVESCPGFMAISEGLDQLKKESKKMGIPINLRRFK